MSAKKKVLLMGNSESFWVKEFVRNVLSGLPEAEVTLFCVKGSKGRWESEYTAQGIRFVELPAEISELLRKSRGSPLELLHYALWLRKYAREHRDYDLINCHFVSSGCLLSLFFFSDLRKKLILSYWGSDLLRQSAAGVWLERLFFLLHRPAFATFESVGLEKDFFEKFQYDSRKTAVMYLGLRILDVIQNTRLEDCWNISGQAINPNKIILAIGYNAIEEQQHLAVIRELAGLPPVLKERILILLQMTYGGTRDYCRRCLEECRKNGFETVLFETYQDEWETAKVRKVTDIFIHAQTSDSLSGSLCEYLYADTVVLNAKWLHYGEMDKYPFVYREFSSFSDLPGLVSETVEQIERSGRFCKQGENRELMWNMRSVQSCAEQWRSLYRRAWNQET